MPEWKRHPERQLKAQNTYSPDRRTSRETLFSRQSYWNGPGLEHLYLRENHEHTAVDGLILGVKDQVPFRAHLWLYAINQPVTVPTIVAVVFNEGNIVGLRLPRGKFLLPILLPLLSKR